MRPKRATSKRFVLLSRASLKPREPRVLLRPRLSDLTAVLPAGDRTSLLALDLETTGTDPSHPDFAIIGIGLADSRGVTYLDWRHLDSGAREYLYARLHERRLTAFNVLFDGAALQAAGLGWLDWRVCSFGLFRQLATEGFDGQRWNLEALQREVLGWEGSNKADLEALLARHKLKKDTMAQLADLEPEPFGRYCGLDAEAAWQAVGVFDRVLDDLGQPGVALRRYHKEEFMTEVRLLAEQQLRGLAIDVPRLQAYRDQLAHRIEAGTAAWLAMPEVAPAVGAYNLAVVAEHRSRQPEQHTKTGTVAARWTTWERKLSELEAGQHFNPRSRAQLAWLFFDKLGYAPLKFTDAGAQSTDKEVLPFLGTPGKHLSGVRKMEKELGYVEAGFAKQRDGVLHVAMKEVGAVTGRLAGGQGDE